MRAEAGEVEVEVDEEGEGVEGAIEVQERILLLILGLKLMTLQVMTHGLHN